MPNVTFDSNTVFGARDSQPEFGIFHLSDRSVATNMLPEQLGKNLTLYRPGQ